MTVPVGWGLMALFGIALSTRFVILMTLPVEMMPKEVVGVASGLVLCISYIGGVIGPLIGGYILDTTGSFDLALIVLTGMSVSIGILALKLQKSGPTTDPPN